MTELTLIRMWDNRMELELGSAFVKLNYDADCDSRFGKFEVPAWSQLYRPLLDVHRRYRLTIESTPELVWVVDRLLNNPLGVTARCIPYIEHVRKRIATDEFLVNAWLEAEREFLTTKCARCKNSVAKSGDPWCSACLMQFDEMCSQRTLDLACGRGPCALRRGHEGKCSA